MNRAMGQSHNVTVVDTDSSITVSILKISHFSYIDTSSTSHFSTKAPVQGDANICKYSANGTFENSQPGCYNVPNNCTTSAAMGMSSKAAASFKFQGQLFLRLRKIKC